MGSLPLVEHNHRIRKNGEHIISAYSMVFLFQHEEVAKHDCEKADQ